MRKHRIFKAQFNAGPYKQGFWYGTCREHKARFVFDMVIGCRFTHHEMVHVMEDHFKERHG